VLGFGELGSALAIQPPLFGTAYVLAGAAALLGVFGAVWVRGRQRRYPYRLGDYLFPCGVLAAHDEQLRLYPFGELRSVSSGGSGLARLVFDTGVFEFALPEGLAPEVFASRIEEYRLRYTRALANNHRKELAALDPLRDSGFSNPLSSKEAFVRPGDKRSWRLAIVAACGIALGLALFLGRNTLAERALYAEARRVHTAAGYLAYLNSGGHRSDVVEVWLPRAELAAASMSLSSVEAYAAAHPGSKIWPEIEEALRRGLRAELEQVSKSPSLGALAAFETQHPRAALVASELASARAAVFSDAYQRFSSATGRGDEVRELGKRLLAYSEAHGPRVEVQFRRHLPKSAERADSAIRRSAYFTGAAALPSQYFAAEHALTRENQASEELVARLQTLFASELVEFKLGAHAEGDGPPSAGAVPTLFVSYTTEMSGGYTTQRPRGVYVGLGMMMSAEFVLPDGGRFVAMKDSAWLPPDVNQIWRDGLRPEQVYDQSARLGLSRFVEEYLTTVFALPPKPATEQTADSSVAPDVSDALPQKPEAARNSGAPARVQPAATDR
jgi:hypothetical protein